MHVPELLDLRYHGCGASAAAFKTCLNIQYQNCSSRMNFWCVSLSWNKHKNKNKNNVQEPPSLPEIWLRSGHQRLIYCVHTQPKAHKNTHTFGLSTTDQGCQAPKWPKHVRYVHEPPRNSCHGSGVALAIACWLSFSILPVICRVKGPWPVHRPASVCGV